MPSSTLCHSADNDLTGLTIDQLQISDSDQLTGNGVTLGSGGLSASGASGFILGPSASTVSVPITLGTAQTWHILGTCEGHFYEELPLHLTLDSGLSGPGALTTDLSGDVWGELQLAGDNEIGPVAIDGDGGADGDGTCDSPPPASSTPRTATL